MDDRTAAVIGTRSVDRAAKRMPCGFMAKPLQRQPMHATAKPAAIDRLETKQHPGSGIECDLHLA